MQYGGAWSIFKIINYLYKEATVYLDRKKQIVDQMKIFVTTEGNGINRKNMTPITLQDLYDTAKFCFNQSDMCRILKCDRGTMTHCIQKFNVSDEITLILLQNRIDEIKLRLEKKKQTNISE